VVLQSDDGTAPFGRYSICNGLVALHTGSLCSRADGRHNYDDANAIVIYR
jgi:hypothetical protein